MLKVILPLALLLAGAMAAWAIVQPPPALETTLPKMEPPQVEIMAVEPRSVRLKIRSQGTVRACTDMKLTAQVDGKVVKMAPGFKEGKFFREGDVLIQIEPRDYDLAVVKAQARVAAAQGELLREEAKADLARKDWQSIGKGEPSPLMLRIPELKEARARLQAAKATLEEARLRRERTELRAPFNGRVQERWVEVGEYVEEGTHLARLFAVDRAEARLPLTPSELAFLDLPLAPRQNLGEKGPKVMLQASLAGKRHSWEGRIVRTEGVIDEKTRMLYAIAEVRDPYGDLGLSPGAPLLVGLFVEAEIEGRTLDHAHLLPRQALRQGSQVLVVNGEHRVSFREVEVLRVEGKWAVVQGSLQRGEAVVVSPLPQAVEGMEVKIGPA